MASGPVAPERVTLWARRLSFEALIYKKHDANTKQETWGKHFFVTFEQGFNFSIPLRFYKNVSTQDTKECRQKHDIKGNRSIKGPKNMRMVKTDPMNHYDMYPMTLVSYCARGLFV